MGTPAVAPTQTPLDAHNWDKNGVLVVADDLRQTLWNLISEVDWAFADLYANTNGVIGSGLQLSNANSGMQVNISAGRGRALNALKLVQLVTPGITGQPNAFNATPVNGVGIPVNQSRIDVICLQYDWATYTDGNSENHTVDETNIKVVQGTVGLTPVAPPLPDTTYLQLGTITVPSGATTMAQCTIDNTKRVTYQDIGTLAALVPSGTVLTIDTTVTPNGFYMLGPTGGPFADGTYDATVDLGLAATVGNRWGTKNGRNLLTPVSGRGIVAPDPTGVVIGTAFAVGTTLGASSVTITTAMLPAHTHTDTGHVHGTTEPAHTHTQVAHGHTDTGHNHTQVAHGHTDSGHSHTHIAHGHTDSGHTHINSLTDNNHTHTLHGMINWSSPGGSPNRPALLAMTWDNSVAATEAPSVAPMSITNMAAAAAITNTTSTEMNAAAVITNTTPTNQSSAAVIAPTTATNNSISTGLSVNSGTAVIQNTGGGGTTSIVQPVVAVNQFIKR